MSKNWVAALILVSACGAEVAPDGHDEALEHTADALTAGTLDCRTRAGTGYQSGAAFPIELVTVDGKAVERRTANAFDRLRRAAATDGVAIAIVSGFRTYAEQARLRQCYETCSCNSCNLASRPGYSNHESGAALDLNTSDEGVYRWLARNAARFDFDRTVPSEDWHWEYFGGIEDEAPCAAGGQSSGGQGQGGLTFTVPSNGGSYTNGLWMKVSAPAGTHHVVYQADGLIVGASEDPRDAFSARYLFINGGTHALLAIAYDADNGELARTSVSVDITRGGQPALALVGISSGDWLRDGLPLAASAGPEVKTVRWMAGQYELARSSDRAAGFAVRTVLQTLGWRVITAVGLDAHGDEVMRRSAVVRVMPGDDLSGPVALRLFDAPGATRANGAPLKSVGSDSIARVTYSADGYELGRSTDARGGFPVSYRFSQTGARRIQAVGYGADGRERARDTVEVTIR